MAAQPGGQSIAKCSKDKEYRGYTRTLEFKCGCIGSHVQCADIFHGQITVRDRYPAANYAAYAPHELRKYPNRVLVWTDASGGAKDTNYAGAAVVFQRGAKQYTHFGFAANLTDSTQAELLAIFEAMYLAFHHVEPHKEVLIFTDSLVSIQWIVGQSLPLDLSNVWGSARLKRTFPRITSFRYPQAAELVKYVTDCSKELQERGISVHLHWVPGHERVVGNERADALSKACRIAALQLNLREQFHHELSIPLTREQIIGPRTWFGGFYLPHWTFAPVSLAPEDSMPGEGIDENAFCGPERNEPQDHKLPEVVSQNGLEEQRQNQLQMPKPDQEIDQSELNQQGNVSPDSKFEEGIDENELEETREENETSEPDLEINQEDVDEQANDLEEAWKIYVPEFHSEGEVRPYYLSFPRLDRGSAPG